MADEVNEEAGEAQEANEPDEIARLKEELFGTSHEAEEEDLGDDLEALGAKLFGQAEEADDDEEEDEPTAKPKRKAKKEADDADEDDDSEEEEVEEEEEKPAAAKPKPKEAAKPEAPAPQAYKARVNGKDYEYDSEKAARALGVTVEELKATPEKTVTRLLQKSISADHAMDSGSRISKEWDSFVGRLEQNPEKALEQLFAHERFAGKLDFDKVLMSRLEQNFRLKAMSEPERRAYQAEQELQQIKAQREYETRQAQQQAQAESQRKFVAELARDMTEALKASGLPTQGPRAKRMVDRVVDYLREDSEARRADPSDPRLGPPKRPADVMQQLKDDFREDFRIFAGSLDAKQLREFLGDEIADKFRAERVKQFKGVEKNETVQPDREPRKPRNRKRTYGEYGL